MSFNPDMLVLAREMRRMTQSRLAQLTGTSQGAISRAENGTLTPSDETLSAWAEALEVPASFFGRDASTSSVPVTFFRKRATLPATDAKQIVATIAVRSWQIERLMNSVEMPTPNISSLAPGGALSPSQIARELRQAWSLPRGPIEDLTSALEAAGILVFVVPGLNAPKFDGLSVWRHRAGASPIMFLNGSVPMDRLRFTMAHELGHIVMHHHQPLPPHSCEDEADEFAAEFLTPASDIGPHLSGLSLNKLAQLKMHWRVSMQALLVRARALRRINQAQSKRLWRQLSAMGYRRAEPVEVPPEQPALLQELLRVHLEDLGYDHEQLAQAVGMLPDEFLRSYAGHEQQPRLRRIK